MPGEGSGLENFFAIGSQESIERMDDPLSWETLANKKVGADGNQLTYRNGDPQQATAGYGSASTGRIDCLKAQDCGSGYVCVNGRCQPQGGGAPQQQYIAGEYAFPPTIGEGCDNTTYVGDIPLSDCFTQGCQEGATCGDNSLPGEWVRPKNARDLNCCGGEKFQCPDPDGEMYWQCFPCFVIDLELPDPMDPYFPPFPDLDPLPEIEFPDGLPPYDFEFPDPLVPQPPNLEVNEDGELEQPEQPANKGCDAYCDNYQKTFGRTGPGCEGAAICSECYRCQGNSDSSGAPVPFSCYEIVFDAPCFCRNGKENCEDCQDCSSTGECVEKVGGCTNECSCTKVCSSTTDPATGAIRVKDVTYHHSQPFFAPGNQEGPRLSCEEECRLIHDQLNTCPPDESPSDEGEDSCGDDPNNPCETGCRCTTINSPCSATEPPCPDGFSCESRGYIEAGAIPEPPEACPPYPDGTPRICFDPNDPSSGCNDSLGGKTWFVKLCKIAEPPPGIDLQCGPCKTSAECGDCGQCVNNFCAPRPECDNPCTGEPCDGACCDENEGCIPLCKYLVLENCHFAPYEIQAPCGGLSLVARSIINASEAVCYRYHTHCTMIDKYGNDYGLHLDCQAGIKELGPVGLRGCIPGATSSGGGGAIVLPPLPDTGEGTPGP